IAAVQGLERLDIVRFTRHGHFPLPSSFVYYLASTAGTRKEPDLGGSKGPDPRGPEGDAMLLNLRETSGPLHRRLYLALKTKIRDGGLAPAARVPSTRVLATDLGVSRNTVLLAYEQLAAEGYLVSRHRGTTSVGAVAPARPAPAFPRAAVERPVPVSSYARRLTERLDLAPSRPPGPRSTLRYDFRYGRPAVDEFPRQIWRRLLAAHARRASSDALGYGSPAGPLPLRSALREYLGRPPGVLSDPPRLVLLNRTPPGP